MRSVAILLALSLAGCEPTGVEKYKQDEERYHQLRPPGRYQMLPVPDEKAVFVLDTGDGSIRKCSPLESEREGESTPMGCGPAATQ
ncbi:hypothetical protein [Parasphingorhabdus sp.]|uniref:hypothetical protein n=1 Tax=Parasphingorhabdus sp. TaxID=2709688 RepID=UPI003D2E8653